MERKFDVISLFVAVAKVKYSSQYQVGSILLLQETTLTSLQFSY